MTLLPPPLTLLESELNDSETWIQGLLTSSCSSFILTFGAAAIGFIISTSVSLVGEECIGSTVVKEFISFLENSDWNPESDLIQKAPLTLLFTLELHSFYTHAFLHFHVFPLSRTCSAVSRWNTKPLCVYLMCWFCCTGRERRKERQLSDWHLRNRNLGFLHSRVCCFWRAAHRRIRS